MLQYYYLVRGVVSNTLIKTARSFAETQYKNNKFHSIHSRTPGEIGRVILACTEDHMVQLRDNYEDDAFVGHDTEAACVVSAFNALCMTVADKLGLPHTELAETEIITTAPHSKGQEPHMDTLTGVWAFLAPLVPSRTTTIKKQTYQNYPVTMGGYSRVPHGWAELPNVVINWKVGDLFVFRNNAIHGGPPNDGRRRYVLFGAQHSSAENEHTDTLVVTEDEFFEQQEQYRRKSRGSSRIAEARY